MKRCIALVLFTFIFITSSAYASYCATSRSEVQNYICELVKKYDFDFNKLQRLFNTVTFDEVVMSKITKPYEAKPWYLYRELFITPDRIDKGVAYWKEHEKTLDIVEKRYGIPASIIVAIIGVETKFGENKGTFPVFNTLVTLGFNDGRRAKFFRSELTEYLLLSRENGFMPLTLKGSYAGALGLPQFMPSSYRHYAVDYSHKGQADLFNNDEDAIASIANYLHKHGWEIGQTVTISANVTGDAYQKVTQKNYKPHLTEAELASYGIVPSENLHNKKVSLINLQEEKGYEHWLGLQNFYVISTYNKSELYVMAVNVLARKMREQKYHSKPAQVAILDEAPLNSNEKSELDPPN